MLKSPANCTLRELAAYAREYARRMATGRSNRPKVMRPCPHCARMFGARELRAHASSHRYDH